MNRYSSTVGPHLCRWDRIWGWNEEERCSKFPLKSSFYCHYLPRVNFEKEYTRLYLKPEEEYFQEGQENSTQCLITMIQNQSCSNPCTVTSIPGVPTCKNV